MSIVKKEDVFDQAGLAAALDAPKDKLNALTSDDFSRGCFSVDTAPSMTNATIFPSGHSVAWGFGSRLSVNFDGENWVHATANVGDTYGQYHNRIWDGTGSHDVDRFQTGLTDSPLNYDNNGEGWVIIRTSDPGMPTSHTASADNGSVPALVNFASQSSSLADKNITGILVRGSCEFGRSPYDIAGSGVMLGIAVKVDTDPAYAFSGDEWHILEKSIGQFTQTGHQYGVISTGCLITDTDITAITHSAGGACITLKDIALVSCIARFWGVGYSEVATNDDEYEIGGYSLSCLPLLAGTLE